MRPLQIFFLLSLFVALGVDARAGQVSLKNGDRITGTVVKADHKAVTLKTGYAGDITIPWSAIASVTSEEPLHVSLADGTSVAGPARAECEQIQVRSEARGTVMLPLARVAAVRSSAEQALFERRQNASIFELWTGSVDAGFSLARGNRDTTTLTAGMNASRATARDKITTYATSVYSRNGTPGANLTAANTVRAGGRYDVNLTDRVFAFGSLDFERNPLQKLDLRSVFGSGFGWHVRRGERAGLDVFGGVTVNRELLSELEDRTLGEAIIGQELTHKLSDRVLLKQRFSFYPVLTDGGEYRFTVDASAVTSLNRWLGVHVTLSDRYSSNPAPGAEENDLLLTTGLRFTFAH